MNITNKKWRFIDGIFITLRYSPICGLIIILYQFFNGFIPAISIGVTAVFINTAIRIATYDEPLSNVYLPLFFMLLLMAFNVVSDRIIGFFRTLVSLRLQKALNGVFMEKQARLAYHHIEDQESWDLIARMANNPEEIISSLRGYLLGIINFIIAVASVLFILTTQVWWAGILIVTISIPSIFVAFNGGKKQYKARRDTTKFERKYLYLIQMLTSRNFVLERALFGYSPKINEQYTQEYEKARVIKYDMRKRTNIRNAVVSCFTAATSLLILVVMIFPVYEELISIGVFIALTNALVNLINRMSWEFPDQVTEFAKNKERLKDLNAFSALTEEFGGELAPTANAEPFQSLEFRNVSFKYPKSDKEILKGLSFTIKRGGHYSFVGVNGAGKTTITKIMTGLFRNYEGTILLNGRDLHEYAVNELKAIFCGVFQDFARYDISIRDNVAVGNASNIGDEAISAAIATAGLSDAVAKHETGLDTHLGKINANGIDFSGGEWQRLAMARAIVNPADVLILDEPTAALDPIGESKVYQKFEEISRGKTTIFISHRLGSTKLAETIFVLDDGKLAQSGSFEQLIKQGGIYSEMYESQRGWYI